MVWQVTQLPGVSFVDELRGRGLASQAGQEDVTQWAVSLVDAPAVAQLASGMGLTVRSWTRFKAHVSGPAAGPDRVCVEVLERSAADVARASARVLFDWDARLRGGQFPVRELSDLKPLRRLGFGTLSGFVNAVNEWDTDLRQVSREVLPYTVMVEALAAHAAAIDSQGRFGDAAPAQEPHVEVLGTLLADAFVREHHCLPVASGADTQLWAMLLASAAVMRAGLVESARALAPAGSRDVRAGSPRVHGGAGSPSVLD
jgi:hypothetical protein